MRPEGSQEELPAAKTWEIGHAAGIGKAVKKQRGRRPAVWLESRTQELGLKMTRQSIADLESGRRRYVTTAELLVLAAALNTTPVALMYPNASDEPDNVVEVLPALKTTGFQAAQWFSGHRYGLTEDADAAEADRRRAALNAELLRGWRQLDELRRRRDRLATCGRGQLTRDQLELLDFYNSEIERLRDLLLLLDEGSPGGRDHA